MTKFTLIAATQAAYSDQQQKLIESLVEAGETFPLIESLTDEFKKVLTKLRDRQSVDLKTVAGYMAGIDLMTNPEHKDAKQELIQGGDLAKAGIQANIVDPRSINLIDQNKAVRDGLAVAGWKFAQGLAQKYYHELQNAQSKGDVNVAVPVMKSFLQQLRTNTAVPTKPTSVGIKQKMDQQRTEEQPPASTVS